MTSPTTKAWCIRPANVTDLASVMELETAGFALGIREATTVFRQRLSLFGDGFFLMTKPQHQTAIGYATYEIWHQPVALDRSMFKLGHDIQAHHNKNGSVLYLASMTIAPAYRGQGLARELLTSTINIMRQKHPRLQGSLLIVNEAWSHARHLYHQLGFQTLCTWPDFFVPRNAPSQSAIVMGCQLGNNGISPPEPIL